MPRPFSDPQHPFLFQKRNDRRQPVTRFQVGKGPRTLAAHAVSVAFHYLQRGPHVRREVGFIDHQKIGFGDPRPALARDFFPLRPRR